MLDDNETNLKERISVLESRLNALESHVKGLASGPTLKCPVCSKELRVKEATFSDRWVLSDRDNTGTQSHNTEASGQQDAKHIWFIFCTNCGYSTEVPKA